MEPGGGAYRYFRDLLQCLNAELQPTLISLPSASLTPEIERMAHESGACVIPIQMKSRWDFSTLSELRKAVRKHRIHHANLQLSSLFWGNKTTFAALRMAGVRHLALTAHAVDPPKEGAIKTALHRAETRFHSHFVTDWVALARYDWPIFSRLGAAPSSITILHPCVPHVSTEVAIDWESLVRDYRARGVQRWIGFVGVLRRAKGVFDLLESFDAIAAEFHDVGLLIVGDGEERTALVERCTRLNLAHRILFAGYRSDGRALLRRCDACILPSQTEHYPYVLLEAMAEGIAIVATRVGAVPELLGDGERGMLVPSEDVAALADALRKVLSDRGSAQKSIEKARKFVQETCTMEHFNQAVNAFHRRWLRLEE
jgi:glycosyltransferase involved in cell wall biosynthesis